MTQKIADLLTALLDEFATKLGNAIAEGAPEPKPVTPVTAGKWNDALRAARAARADEKNSLDTFRYAMHILLGDELSPNKDVVVHAPSDEKFLVLDRSALFSILWSVSHAEYRAGFEAGRKEGKKDATVEGPMLVDHNWINKALNGAKEGHDECGPNLHGITDALAETVPDRGIAMTRDSAIDALYRLWSRGHKQGWYRGSISSLEEVEEEQENKDIDCSVVSARLAEERKTARRIYGA